MNKKCLIAVLCATLAVLSLVAIATARAVRSEPGGRPAEKALAPSSDVEWTQVNLDGFGDATNAGVMSLEYYDGELYAGVSNGWYGGQVWRTADGNTWEQVSSAGFTSAYTTTNTALIDMIVFSDTLYVSTGWSWVAPGQIWRFPHYGWEPVEEAGFGDPGNTAIAAFGIFSDTLYVTTGSSNGLEIWCSTTGNSGDWLQVVDDGNGNTHNGISTSLIEFDSFFYAAVENGTDGAEIWRTEDGLTWTTVITGGFNSISNTQTGGFAIFGENLYIGTRNDTTGAQVWRTSNGTEWTQVVGDGFGDLNNFKIESLAAFEGALYAGTDNEVTGIEVWRSVNGTDWEQINEDGFGYANNIGTLWSSGTAVFHGDLYMGTANYDYGGGVWTMVTPITDFASVSAGMNNTCAVTVDGGAKCWGNNEYYKLCNLTDTNSPTPVDLYNNWPPYGIRSISAGRNHTCAVLTSGGAKCGGDNSTGQLGINRLETPWSTLVTIDRLTSGTRMVSAGGHHTCAVTTTNGAKCWGYGIYGQLGIGNNNAVYAPVDVSGLTSGVSTISAGWGHTCALTTGGGVKCWGYNNHGQLGNNSNSNYNTPQNVSGLSSGVDAISAGLYHTCALMDVAHGGGVKCWGSNANGKLGDGTNEERWTPVDVSGLSSGAVAISAGWDHTCALMDSGGVMCWGSNLRGKLGDGTNEARWTPVDVWGLSSGVLAISAGDDHTCALMENGGIKCWGSNSNGQLGHGDWYDFWTPVDVVELKAPPLPTPSPSVISITRADPNPTGAASLHFAVTFSQPVTGVDTGDFSLTTSGISGASVTGITGTGTTYTVTVGTGSGTGTLRLDITDDDSIVNSLSNPLGGTGAGNGNFTSGEVYTIDKTAPGISSITRLDSNPTNAASVRFIVTFSEPVSGVNTADFSLTTSGISGASVAGVIGSGTNYTITVGTGSGSGTLRLDVSDDDSIVDIVSNPLGGTGAGNGNFTSGEAYTIDKTAPTVASIVRTDPNPTNAASVRFIVAFSKAVTGVDTTDFSLTTSGISGASVSGVTGSSTTYTVTVGTGSGSGTLRLDVTDDDSILDALLNPLGGTGAGNGNFTGGEVYTIRYYWIHLPLVVRN